MSDIKEIEELEMRTQFMQELSVGNESTSVNNDEINRKKAKAKIDSAGGLPSRHNPGCVLENNPFYYIRIYRPTDLRITVSQFDVSGKKSNFTIHPFSIYLMKNPHSTTPVRLEQLEKEDIVASTGSPQKEKILNLYLNTLEPGLYLVLVATYLSGMQGNFTVGLLSNHRAEFAALWPPQWLLKGEKMPEKSPSDNSTVASYSAGKTISTKNKNSSSNFFRDQIKNVFGAEDLDDDDDDDDEDG
jgi:hypothetical protein